jgi:dipeptidyl aminopeptidase/acylaminoacyl peptidase
MHIPSLALAALGCLAPVQQPQPQAREVAARAQPIEALAATRIFYLRDEVVWTCDGNGEHERRWSPDGLQLSLHAWPSPTWRQFVVDDPGDLNLLDENGHHTVLGRRTHGDGQPVWSPDGQAIAFPSGSRDLGDSGIWLVDDIRTPTDPRCLTPSGARESHPAWSPCGRWLALAAADPVDGWPPQTRRRAEWVSHLVVVDRTTGVRTPACTRMGAIDAIAWAPDARHLAFRAADELVVVAMAGCVAGPARVLAVLPRGEGFFTWTPDSAAVLADYTVVEERIGRNARGAQEALLLAPLHGEPRRIELRMHLSAAAIDPSGEWLAFTGYRSLHRMHLASGTIEELPMNPGWASPLAWERR